jgi:hypothetical protein
MGLPRRLGPACCTSPLRSVNACMLHGIAEEFNACMLHGIADEVKSCMLYVNDEEFKASCYM